jgi:hypothetical protein
MRGWVLGVALMGCHAPVVQIVETEAGADAALDVLPEPPVDPAFDRVAEAYCNVAARCMPIELRSLWGSIDDCKKRYPRYIAHLTSGFGSRATPAERRACAEALDVTDCAKAVRMWTEGDKPAACRIPGALPVDAPCGSDWQCATMHCSGSCGKCVDPLPMSSKCSSQPECPFGQVCLSGKCAQPRELDEPCVPSIDLCHFDLACSGGKCVRAPTAGEACLEGADIPCARGRDLRCDPATKTCVLWKIGTKVGDPCGPSGIESVLCDHGLTCKELGPLLPGKCVRAHDDGEACNQAFYSTPGGPCQFPDSCIRNVCRELELQDCSNPGAPP